jgi:hypothetical protein
MKTLSRVVAGFILLGLTMGLSSCAPAEVAKPDVKAKSTACLIRSTTIVPGTPEKQLAVDLVEAKIFYGLAVREVKIDEGNEYVPKSLLTALQDGCVIMVSANPAYLSDLAQFALGHSKMMVLFVGGKISIADQPSNFRWVEDDALSGARLAGFFAAGKSVNESVNLFIQPAYSDAKRLKSSFIRGVSDYDELSGTATRTVFAQTPTSKTLTTKLDRLASTDVAAIFGGKSIWKNISPDQADRPYLIGADLQLGSSELALEPRVQVSVERNTSKYVLNAVAALLNREFSALPLYRKTGALEINTVELRVSQPDSIDGELLTSLETYRQSLISPVN